MHVINLLHYLDEKGCVAPSPGGAARMAEFLTAVVAHESDELRTDDLGPNCFKCNQDQVDTEQGRDGAILWNCYACGTEGRISHWQGTLWDLSEREHHH